jgi:transcriptional regulator with XRE-family HTH domain
MRTFRMVVNVERVSPPPVRYGRANQECRCLTKERSSRRKPESGANDKARPGAGRLDELRIRAGLSMDQLAKAMGYKGQSSIQRYLSTEYDLGFRPQILGKFKKPLLGKGNPPITERDFDVLEETQRSKRFQDIEDEAEAAVIRDIEAADATRVRAVLPLPEGNAIFQMPKGLSPKSLEFLKTWVDLILAAAREGRTDTKT